MKHDTIVSAIVTGLLVFAAVANGSIWLGIAAGAVAGGWFDRVMNAVERSLLARVPRRLHRGW